MSLSVEQLESLEALGQIEPEWLALWEQDAAATPFESPEWLLPWTRHLWGGGKLRVLAVRNSGALVGLAPLFYWGYGAKPEIIRVSLLGSGISDHLGMIAAPAFALDAARAALEHLALADEEWHLCDLLELRSGSPLLRTEVPAGLARRDAPCSICPVLRLPPSMEELLAGIDAGFRHNLRTAQNRLNREGRIEFVRAMAPGDVTALMNELFRLHESRWRERGQSGMLDETRLRQFHLESAERFTARDMLRLHALRCDGRTIAVQYNFCRGGRHYCYLSGFDPEYSRSSPGAVLLAESIRQAIGEAAREIDFLRKGEDFKYRWGARDVANRKLLLTHSTARVRKVGGTIYG